MKIQWTYWRSNAPAPACVAPEGVEVEDQTPLFVLHPEACRAMLDRVESGAWDSDTQAQRNRIVDALTCWNGALELFGDDVDEVIVFKGPPGAKWTIVAYDADGWEMEV